MKVLVVISDSHRELYEQWFLPGLPGDAELEVRTVKAAGDGRYLSEGWKSGVMAKLEWVLEFCRAHPEEVFILSDVDIQFFDGFALRELREILGRSGRDILFQKERSSPGCQEVNTGFYVARATVRVSRLFTSALELAEKNGERNDQVLMNSLLGEETWREMWGHLPAKYYARSHGFPPSDGIVLHHANLTASVAEKQAQLRRVRKWVEGGWLARITSLAGECAVYLRAGKFPAMIRRKLGFANPRKQMRAQETE
jgi:hypothetical protein